jgi:SpoVK/Ycf46/Vps4 family AAA+-type ATPase
MSTGTDEVQDYLGCLEDSNTEENGSNGGSENAGSPQGIDPKAFTDLANAVTGIQNQLGKWGNEMGSLRQTFENQQSQTMPEGSSDQASDALSKFMDDPQKFISEIAMNASSQQQQNQQQQVNAVRQAVMQDAPDFGEFEDDIIDQIVSDHNGTIDKRAVMNDLYTLGRPALLNAYHRAKNARKLSESEKLIEVLKNQGVDLDQAKRALTRNHSSGDSFSPPSINQVPKTAPRDMTSEQRKAILAKIGVNNL